LPESTNQSQDQSNRVFVSHCTSDREYVESQIIPCLREWGLEPWYSQWDIRGTEDWSRRIQVGLESCPWFLVVLSKHSVSREWVRTEVHWAMEHRVGRVVPVVIDECRPEDCHLMLRRVPFIDFRWNFTIGKQQLRKVWHSDEATSRALISEHAADSTEAKTAFQNADGRRINGSVDCPWSRKWPLGDRRGHDGKSRLERFDDAPTNEGIP
jgi:hypothetical protein